MSSSKRAESATGVNATPSTLATLRRGAEARLVTAMIVREDSMTLYGFADTETRDLFQTLLSVSGVGPRLAMATLAVHEAPALCQALADGDVTALTRVPRHRQARRRTHGRGTARQGQGRERGRVCWPPARRPPTAMRCAAPWSRPWWAFALPPSRPRRPPIGCWPMSRKRAVEACGQRCRSWATNEPLPDDATNQRTAKCRRR